MLKTLQQFIDKPEDSIHHFAVELTNEIVSTFSYILDPDSGEDVFCPEFLTASYFSPEFKFLIKDDQKAAVRRYLEGKFIVYRKECKTDIKYFRNNHL